MWGRLESLTGTQKPVLIWYGCSIPSAPTKFHYYLFQMALNESYKNRLQELSGIKTDCKEEIGNTVGLIDSIITQCRLLRKRKLDSKEVKEALQDLMDDEDLKFILDQAQSINEGTLGKMIAGAALGGAMAFGSPGQSHAQTTPKDSSITMQQTNPEDLRMIQQKTHALLDSLYSKGWKAGYKFKGGGKDAFARFKNNVGNIKNIGNNIYTAPDDVISITTPWGYYHPTIDPTGVQQIINGGFKTLIPIYD